MIDAKTRYLILKDYSSSVHVQKSDKDFVFYPLWYQFEKVYDLLTDCKYCSDSQVNYCPIIPGFNDKIIKNCRRCAAVMNVPYYYNSDTGEICLK